MKIINTDFEGLFIIEPTLYGDQRGWFMETYSKEKLLSSDIDIEFVQDNHSYSKQKGTLRGLHFQIGPMAQTKLIRCTHGEILDVVVDLRQNSSTYRKWFSIELSDVNLKQLLIPKGFAHGFLTLTENVEVQYKVDQYYSPEHDRSIRFDDPEIAVQWGVEQPILSDKDLNASYLKDSDVNFY